MGSRQRLSKIRQDALIIQGAELSPLHSVRDLGFIIDSKLTMSDHVNNVVRSCFFQLRQLRSVRHSLPIEARKALVHCFISSRIDYCNAILYGVSGAVLRCLQTVLNAAARLIVDAGQTSTHDADTSRSPLVACEGADPVQDRDIIIPVCKKDWTGVPRGDVYSRV